MKNIHILPTDKPSRLGQVHEKLSFFKDRTWDNTENWRCKNIYITNDEEIKEGDYGIHPITLNISKHHSKDNNLTQGWKKIILTTDQDLIKDGVQAIDDKFLEWFVKNPSCEEVKVELKPMFPMYKTFKEDINTPPFYGNLKYKIIIPQEEPKQEWNPTQGEEVWIKVFSNWSKGIYIGYDVTKQTHIVREEEKGGGNLYSSTEVLPYSAMPNEPKQETLEEAFSKELKSKGLEFSSNLNPLDMFNLGAKWQAERMYSEEEVKEILMKTDRFLRADLDLWFEQFKKK